MQAEEIDLVVLAGGHATRIAGLCQSVPKALLPVLDAPFLAYQIAEIARSCPLRRIIVSIRQEHSKVFERTGLAITLAQEMQPQGTGGAILSLADKDLTDPFLVINGDVLFRMNAAALAANARQKGAAITAIHVDDGSRFATLTVMDGCVSTFQEKTAANQDAWISAGLYAFTKKSLARFERRNCSFEFDIAPVLAKSGELGVYKSEGPFIDIGTPESYARIDNFVITNAFTKVGREPYEGSGKFAYKKLA